MVATACSWIKVILCSHNALAVRALIQGNNQQAPSESMEKLKTAQRCPCQELGWRKQALGRWATVIPKHKNLSSFIFRNTRPISASIFPMDSAQHLVKFSKQHKFGKILRNTLYEKSQTTIVKHYQHQLKFWCVLCWLRKKSTLTFKMKGEIQQKLVELQADFFILMCFVMQLVFFQQYLARKKYRDTSKILQRHLFLPLTWKSAFKGSHHPVKKGVMRKCNNLNIQYPRSISMVLHAT